MSTPIPPSQPPVGVSPDPEQLAARIADLADVIVSLARKAHARVQRVPEIIELTQLEIFVMRYIEKHPGTTAREIAAQWGLQSSNASTVLRTLSQQGLIERTPDRDDHRTMRLHITAQATANSDRIRAEWVRMIGPHITAVAQIPDIVRFLTDLDFAIIDTSASWRQS